jgi:hypothetical protein
MLIITCRSYRRCANPSRPLKSSPPSTGSKSSTRTPCP